MERSELKAIVENLLLASDNPVSADHLHQTLVNGTDKTELKSVLEELRADYESKSLQVVEVAEGFQLCTRPEYSEWIRKFLKLDKTFRLSQPALDTLSIIAYKQPLTKTEVEEIRGVDCSGVIKTLLEKKIINPGGRKDVPGKPIMYKTTQKFLEYFGLRDLSELPTLEDFNEEIEGEEEPQQTELFVEGKSPAQEDSVDPDLPAVEASAGSSEEETPAGS